MAQIVINIPDTVVGRVLDAFAATYRYAATLPDGSPNPQTKAQFAKQRVLAYVKEVVVACESAAAGAAASTSAAATATTDVALT